MSQKKALLVGINYPSTSSELRGCVNDVVDMQGMLREMFGFSQIKTLLDEQATTNNILNSLEALVHDAEAGDVLFFHYSGHGSQMLTNYGTGYEDDGLDEIICPIDLDWKRNVVRDNDLSRIFDKVPAGVSWTVVLDCCNSGGGMDHLEQYQPDVANRSSDRSGDNVVGRYMVPPDDVVDLSLAGVKPRRMQIRDINKTGLLITGCQANQTSADAYIDGRFNGALTYTLIQTMKENAWNLDYKTLIDNINQKMVTYGFTQRPELNGPSKLYNTDFASIDNHSDLDNNPDSIPTNIVADVAEPETFETEEKLNIIEKLIRFVKELFLKLF